MSKIVIGTTGEKQNVSIDLDVLMTTRLLVTADSGGGKTVLLKRLCEQMFGKVPILIIDPEGEFAPLREKFDFVLIGKGGESPADSRSAALVAQTLLKLHASAVCDIYEMKEKDRHLFVANFCDGLINAPKELWHPTVVIVDEAHMFAPEGKAGESEASESVKALSTRGRKRGLCPIFATQRLAEFSKGASSMCLNRLVGGTFEDVNQKRALEVLSVSSEEKGAVKAELKMLEPGQFYALGRAICKERTLVNVGPIVTPHGQEAKKYALVPPPPPDQIKALLPKLADLPKLAEEKAATEAELRQENRSLKAQLRQVPTKVVTSPAPKPTRVDMKRATAPLRALLGDAMKIIAKINAIGFEGTAVTPEDVKAAMEATAKQIAKLAESRLKSRQDEFNRLKADVNRLMARLKKTLDDDEISVAIDVKRNEPLTISQAPPPRAQRAQRPQGEPNGDLTRPQQRVLAALAEFAGIGIKAPSRSMVASWLGVKAGTGSFKNYLSELRVRGFVRDPSPDRLSLTEEGEANAPEVQAAVTTEELLRRSESVLGSTTAKILRMVHEEFPGFVTRESVAERLGISAGTGSFKNYISELRTAGMIEDGTDRTIRAAEWMMLG